MSSKLKICLIYNKPNQATTGAYIEKVIKNSGLDYTHFWTEKSSAIPKEFDLYLRVDHGDYKYDIPADLRPAVFYVIDTHLKKPYKKIKQQVRHYDIVFCAQKEGAQRLARETKSDSHWLPLACDPQIHKKTGAAKQYDIGFVGNPAGKFARGRQLEFLRKAYPNSFIGNAEFTRMGEIYSVSRLGFNSSLRNDINMRVFEIMSSGCFLLTNAIKNNGMEELFQSGKHFAEYKNDRQLAELADYYLRHDQERGAIAQSGYELVISKHTYFHRVQTMFNYIAYKFGGKYNDLRI